MARGGRFRHLTRRTPRRPHNRSGSSLDLGDRPTRAAVEPPSGKLSRYEVQLIDTAKVKRKCSGHEQTDSHVALGDECGSAEPIGSPRRSARLVEPPTGDVHEARAHARGSNQQRGLVRRRAAVDSDAKCNATSARAHQGKARFSFLLRRLPLDFGDAKAAPGKGKSRRFKALRRCTSRRNSGRRGLETLSRRKRMKCLWWIV